MCVLWFERVKTEEVCYRSNITTTMWESGVCLRFVAIYVTEINVDNDNALMMATATTTTTTIVMMMDSSFV